MSIAIRSGAPAFSNSVATSVSLTLSGTTQPQASDVLIIIHCNDFYLLSNMPTPTVGGSTAGVTAITGASADGGSNEGHAKGYYYVVSSTGNLTVAVTETGTSDEEKSLFAYVLSGADITTVIDGSASGSASGTSQSTMPLTAISPATSDAYLIGHVSSGGGSNITSFTPPSGMTEVYDQSNGGGMGTTGAVQQLSASGTTGTKTFTGAGAAPWAGLLIAVLTATGAPAPADPSAFLPGVMPGLFTPSGFWVPDPYDYGTSTPLVNAVTDPEAGATVTGYDAQAAVTAAAGEADASVTGYDASAAASTNTTNADATAVASDAQASVGVPAGLAAVTVTGYDITVQTDSNPSGGEADASVTGYDVQAAAGALAGQASGTVTGYDASASVSANAGEADATVTGYDAQAALSVNAGEADASVTGYDATVQTNSNPAAGEADATATGYDATVSTSGSTNAPAGEADATVTGYDAGTSVTVDAGAASATVTGLDAQAAAGVQAGTTTASAVGLDALASVAPAAGAGVASAAAFDVSVQVGAGAGSASAGATAYDATASGPTNAPAGFAAVTVTAYDATIVQTGGVVPFGVVDSSGGATITDSGSSGSLQYDGGTTAAGSVG